MTRLILICALLNVLQLQAKHKKMNLQKAIEMNLVKAKANSNGGYQGYCIKINIRNLSADSLIILVEAGRRLNSVEDKYQDILITKEELITLKKSEEKNCNVKGYCCQANNCAPSANAVYGINKIADSNLVKLARFLNKNCFSGDAEQHAIWAISNNHLTANIATNSDSLLLPLRQLVANLKGEKLPWYSILCGTYMYQNGVIANYPIALKGKLIYSNDTEDYVTLFVYNEKGQEVCLIRSQWLKAGKDNSYELNLPLKNLVKGKYTVALKTPERELVNKEFEI
jgi:hypothetical protein